MDNIIGYLKEFGGYTFSERPFNEVDALILAQFSYFGWGNVIPGLSKNTEAVSLEQMKEKMDASEVFYFKMYEIDNKKLWAELLASRRFAHMKCNYISDIFSETMQTQFCAFTVFPEGELPVVIYRGTDDTILGWKEDYDMAKDAPIAGQRIASMYLRQVALRLEGDFMVVGHSKGGNLAVFSVLDNNEDVQKRVAGIYNYDGPHFRKDILDNYEYEKIKDKIHKYIPQSSVVGILMETEHDYKVVYSAAHVGSKQHNPYNWAVKRGEFVYEDDVHGHSKRLNEMLQSVIGNMDNDQIELIGRLIFAILEAGDISSTEELWGDERKSISQLLASMKNMQPELKEQIKELVGELIKESFSKD